MNRLTHLSLFSGVGGLDIAAEWAGIETVGQCEWADYPTKVLEKHWPGVPRWRDIKEFSGWDLGREQGLCYNRICVANDSGLRTWKTCDERMKRKLFDEYINSARIAGEKCPCLQAWLQKVQDSVRENADTHSCAAETHQTPAAESGCAGRETQTGSEASAEGLGNGIQQLRLDGEGWCWQETDIPVTSAAAARDANSSPTTSSPGHSIQNSAMNCLMESLFAGNATPTCTRKGARLDVLSGGVPCQPASVAGKRRGQEDDRWLWGEAIRLIRETNPTWTVLENVYGLVTLQQGMALENILLDLEGQGYSVQSFVVPACGVDAQHQRYRIAIVGHAKCSR